MSKKQREKVEDEVRIYQALRAQNDVAPDSVYETPSSSDQFPGQYNG